MKNRLIQLGDGVLVPSLSTLLAISLGQNGEAFWSAAFGIAAFISALGVIVEAIAIWRA